MGRKAIILLFVVIGASILYGLLSFLVFITRGKWGKIVKKKIALGTMILTLTTVLSTGTLVFSQEQNKPNSSDIVLNADGTVRPAPTNINGPTCYVPPPPLCYTQPPPKPTCYTPTPSPVITPLCYTMTPTPPPPPMCYTQPPPKITPTPSPAPMCYTQPPPTCYVPPPPKLWGDVDMNNRVNIVDALFVAQHSIEMKPKPFNEKVADVDGSGEINVIDALLIAQKYVKIIDKFPVEE